MTNLVFAIPSLGRSEEYADRTVSVLSGLSVPLDQIYVFVVEEEKAAYENNAPEGVKIVVGKRGIGNQRTFINGYFEPGTPCVVLDDDVQYFYVKDENKVKRFNEPLIPVAERAFELCDKVGARMWTVTNTSNGFFMKHASVFGLRNSYGPFYGEYSGDPDTQSQLPHCEDFEKGIKHYVKYGGFVRLDDMGVEHTHHDAGGVQEFCGGQNERLQLYAETASYILETYPDLVTRKGWDPKKPLLKAKIKTTSRHPSIFN